MQFTAPLNAANGHTPVQASRSLILFNALPVSEPNDKTVAAPRPFTNLPSNSTTFVRRLHLSGKSSQKRNAACFIESHDLDAQMVLRCATRAWAPVTMATKTTQAIQRGQMSMVSVIIPLGLALVMFGVGLTLTYADFGRIAAYPAAMTIALACQMLIMPMVAFSIIKALGLEPEFAVGLMLLAAAPGGPIASLYSYLSGGDVALSITLTAVNSILSIFIFPLIVGLAVRYFLGKTQIIPLQTAKTVATMAVVIVPVLLGTSLRSHRIALASSIQPWVKGLSVAFLAGITVQVLYTHADELRSSLMVTAAAALFSVASLAIGFLASRCAHLQKNQAIAITFEVGVHNTGLAASLALSPLMYNNPRLSVPPTLCGLFSLVLACALAIVVRRKR